MFLTDKQSYGKGYSALYINIITIIAKPSDAFIDGSDYKFRAGRKNIPTLKILICSFVATVKGI